MYEDGLQPHAANDTPLKPMDLLVRPFIETGCTPVAQTVAEAQSHDALIA
jgi:hypothetical protein